MDDAPKWGKSRAIILCAVISLHVAMLALLLAVSQKVRVPLPADQSVEILLIPPTKPPRVRAENAFPQRLRTNIAVALAPPLFNSSVQSGSSSAPAGGGPAVNWTAEAHRALRAFEIRRDQPPSSAVSVSSPLDELWARPHRAGDQFKTDSGDWIVWINADCYEIAGWHSGGGVFGARPSEVICQTGNGAPRRR